MRPLVISLGLLFLSLLAALSWYALIYLPNTELADFSVYRGAARQLLEGLNIYDPTVHVSQRGAQLGLKYLYPPLLAVGLSWLESLAPSLLTQLWCSLSWAAILGAISLLTGALFGAERPLGSPLRFLGVGLCFLLWPPLWDSLMWGQVNTFVLFLLCLTAWYMQQQRSCAAGAALAGAVFLKASPALLVLPFITQRNTRALSGFLATSGALFLISTLSPRGFQVWGDFAAATKTMASQQIINDPFYDYALTKLMGPEWGTLAALLIFTAYASLCLRFSRLPGAFPLLFSSGIAFMTCLAPCVWFHHLTWLIVPITFCFEFWRRCPALTRAAPIACGMVFLILGTSLYAHVIARHWLHTGETLIKALIPLATILLGVLVSFPLWSCRSLAETERRELTQQK